MRRFSDGKGAVWDVVAGRESWGAIVALFVPLASGGTVLQATLDVSGYAEAEAELDRMSEDDLRTLLDRSRPKTL